MLKRILERGRPVQPDPGPAFYKRNDAMPGPNNLLRRQISDRVIAHGDGTFDVCIGPEQSW